MIIQKFHTMEEYKKVLSLHDLGLGSTKISRMTGIPKSTIYAWLFKGSLPKYFSKRYREARLKNLSKAKQKIAELKEIKLLELSKKITKDFAYVLGAVLGDGYIYFNKKGGGHIRISVKDKDFALNFYNSLKKWSNLNCRMYNYRGFWRVYSSSVVVARVLKSFDRNKLKNMTKEIISAFLRGLYDAEGNVNNRRIRFYNSDINLICLVKEFLEIIGINSLTINKRDKEIHSINGREVIVKPVFTLEFGRKKNLEIFYNKVGFSIKRKQVRLEKIITSYQRNQISWTKKELEFLKNNSHRNYHKIAAEMGRNVNSVRRALYRYELKPKIDNRLLV